MFHRVMTPLDGSGFAEAALPLALHICATSGADLHLVSVQEHDVQVDLHGWEEAEAEWRARYLEALTELLRAAHPDVGVSTRVLAGHIGKAIEDEAGRVRADLVVMASHGRGAAARFWLGSVTDHFIHHSRHPVVVVRPAADERPRELEAPLRVRRILVPLDGSELSEEVLPAALALGALFDTGYHLVRAVRFPRAPTSSYIPHAAEANRALVEDAESEARSYLQTHADRLIADGLDVSFSTVAVPQPARGILTEARERECDVIAMATHGHTGLARAFLGSTADKVMRGTDRTLLLVRTIPDASAEEDKP